mgnify:FL=1
MKVAMIGAGLMGAPMAGKLLEREYDVLVYNRTKSKAEYLVERGADICDSAADAVKQSEIIVVMLSDYYAICETLFKEKIDYSSKKVFQMSTISPGENLILSERISKLGGEFIEAPVLGSIKQVQERELFVLVGSTEKQFEENELFLKAFGDKIIHVGKIGKASALKLALNHLIASITNSFSLSLGYVLENKINVETFMEILRESALYAPTFDKKLDNMLNRDFDNPNFPLKHLLKDVNLISDEFTKSGLFTAQLDGVRETIKKGLQLKNADKDYSSLYNAVHPKKK